MNAYASLVRPLLFRCDAESMHDAAISLGRVAGAAPIRWLIARRYGYCDPRLRVRVAGLCLANPLGLAAGFDKNGVAIDALSALGFGHVEIGSVSAAPSAGNPKPRLFRLPADEAIVVHYGLPNEGAARVAARLARRRRRLVLGLNVVKTNRGAGGAAESPDEIVQDYLESIRVLQYHADYFVLNLSCPNTENGRNHFASRERIEELLTAVQQLALGPPLFLKVSPVGGMAALDRILEAADRTSCVQGFAFNLAPGVRPGLRTPSAVTGSMPGALAGRPVRRQLDERIRELYARMDRQRYTIIGIGGVFTAEDAYAKIRAGASIVQLLTGLVYRGPGVVQKINRGLVQLLERDRLDGIEQAVGLDAGC